MWQKIKKFFGMFNFVRLHRECKELEQQCVLDLKNLSIMMQYQRYMVLSYRLAVLISGSKREAAERLYVPTKLDLTREINE